MHILGKILAWMLVIGAGASVTLLSRQLQIRNSYTEKLKDLRKENEDRAQRIAQKEKQLSELNDELARVNFGWDRYWDKRPGGGFTTNDPAKASLADNKSFKIGVGTRDGVGAAVRNPALKLEGDLTYQSQLGRIIHAFRTKDANSSEYVGSFQLPVIPKTANETQPQMDDRMRRQAAAAASLPESVRMVPIWKLRAGEFAGWGSGPNISWRYRSAVFGGYPEQLQDYYLKIDELDGRVTIARGNIIKRNDELKAAQDEVNRYREIVAGTDGAGGILADLDREDEKRNLIQARVDALRRELKQNVDLRVALQTEIRKLAATLPRGDSKSP